MMKYRTIIVAAVFGIAALLAVQVHAGPAPSGSLSILEFSTMTPVTGPYVGTANPIRGIPGGGLPWLISSGKGELKSDGKLDIEVTGLVLSNDPVVPAAVQLTNPLPTFRAVVSCQSIDSNKMPTVVNVSTDAFPATHAGDSEIEATVTLPTPCIAPIVFVTTPTGAWIASTGH
jgi:hypothetical protein